jgi:hypothetical protein
MSENKPENAGTPGTPSPSGTPAEVSKPDVLSPTGSQPDTAPASPKVSSPVSHEDSIQSPLKDLPAQSAAPSPAAEEAAVRSSTDDPASASSVTPTDAAQAQQRDAAEARASAAESTARHGRRRVAPSCGLPAARRPLAAPSTQRRTRALRRHPARAEPLVRCRPGLARHRISLPRTRHRRMRCRRPRHAI